MPTKLKRVMINLTETNRILLEKFISKYEELRGVRLSYSALINNIILNSFQESFERVQNKLTNKEKED